MEWSATAQQSHSLVGPGGRSKPDLIRDPGDLQRRVEGAGPRRRGRSAQPVPKGQTGKSIELNHLHKAHPAPGFC